MSEQTYKHPERERNNQEIQDHAREELDKLLNEKAKEAKNEHAETIDEIRQEAKAEALPTSTELLDKYTRAEAVPDPSRSVGKELKKLKYDRTLQSVRKDLSRPERVLSKMVHNPVVDAISDKAENTVARPSGLLTGSIFAFLGSSIFLYYAKHYGYEYNYLLMALFFAGGFVLGLILEFVFRLVKKAPKA